MPRVKPHSHPCQSCHVKTECGGTWEENVDGHHILYRSKGGKWRSGNICSLCPSHHSMVHLGKITISGDADDHLTIVGDRAALSFKL